jgi:hypothetical protein
LRRATPASPRAHGIKPQAALALLGGEAQALTRAAADLALDGDAAALRLCLQGIAPPRKDAPVTFALPANDLRPRRRASRWGDHGGSVRGRPDTPPEGAQIMGLADGFRRTFETTELEATLTALEGAVT